MESRIVENTKPSLTRAVAMEPDFTYRALRDSDSRKNDEVKRHRGMR